ncbi:protocatechuate 3,4-dioxygenase [Microvirga sp. 3-52]|uniref:dioxygenase family protein n=1 Tax=Microvirga sp. 3-52 TaxID=2792425 RepID=UPI001AD010A3|nr:protocatechuate 3,4-dioxygenase [Microvirga sp. 3-52]MBO1908441.1 protocatechuate 3,4-dioxygenase [Microvirga sp. 3-52]MBS7455258.1 protocatechuate 3,4-dioxygenase [Microvirga sp. 3-52]
MTDPSPAALNRRSVLLHAGAALAVAATPTIVTAAELVATPGQTEGPFYPVEFPPDMDGDLVRVTGQAARALGQVIHVSGHVVDLRGQPRPGSVVEIWQCDANGIYRHPRAGGQGRIDHAFQGYGRTQVDEQGRYRFRTIRPVPYPGRTPHIHFAVHVPGQGRLVTQMYVEGEPLNARDGVLNGIRDPNARRSVIVPLLATQSPEPGALHGRFDIVVAA